MVLRLRHVGESLWRGSDRLPVVNRCVGNIRRCGQHKHLSLPDSSQRDEQAAVETNIYDLRKIDVTRITMEKPRHIVLAEYSM